MFQLLVVHRKVVCRFGLIFDSGEKIEGLFKQHIQQVEAEYPFSDQLSCSLFIFWAFFICFDVFTSIKQSTNNNGVLQAEQEKRLKELTMVCRQFCCLC